ncbi:uncharacterized protein G2W53_009624 [Senna tora]|uniref:Uncharacterized protein n=1 Tax=Senna tora TaxID=362788 RepID=A0A835CA85_9FABA|nr:uncharacterized protein G2W53_009624 [Senna tora]
MLGSLDTISPPSMRVLMKFSGFVAGYGARHFELAFHLSFPSLTLVISHTPRRRVLSRSGDSHRGGLLVGFSGESSTPISISSDSGAFLTDNSMALGRDSNSEESLKGFIDGHSAFDL